MSKVMVLSIGIFCAFMVCACGKKAPSPWKEMGFPLEPRYADLEVAEPDQLTIEYSAGFKNTWLRDYTQALLAAGWRDATKDPEYPRFAKDGKVIEMWAVNSPDVQGATVVLKMKNAGAK